MGGGGTDRPFIACCEDICGSKVCGNFRGEKYFCNLDMMEEWEIIWDGKLQEEEGIFYKFTRYARKRV